MNHYAPCISHFSLLVFLVIFSFLFWPVLRTPFSSHTHTQAGQHQYKCNIVYTGWRNPQKKQFGVCVCLCVWDESHFDSMMAKESSWRTTARMAKLVKMRWTDRQPKWPVTVFSFYKYKTQSNESAIRSCCCCSTDSGATLFFYLIFLFFFFFFFGFIFIWFRTQMAKRKNKMRKDTAFEKWLRKRK